MEINMSNKYYLVVVNDRHTDQEFYLYANSEAAIKEARILAKYYCRREEDYQEVHSPLRCHAYTTRFSATYSCEGDNVSVHEVALEE